MIKKYNGFEYNFLNWTLGYGMDKDELEEIVFCENGLPIFSEKMLENILNHQVVLTHIESGFYAVIKEIDVTATEVSGYWTCYWELRRTDNALIETGVGISKYEQEDFFATTKNCVLNAYRKCFESIRTRV